MIGFAGGAGAAAVRYAFAQRERLAEELWSRRLDPYREAWALTSQFSRWPRQNPTIADVQRLHERFRRWFYRDGGLFMSARARKRYEYVQEALAALCTRPSDAAVPVGGDDYDDVVEILSGFRAGLTDDLETRRKRSIILTVLDRRADRRARRELDDHLAGIQTRSR